MKLDEELNLSFDYGTTLFLNSKQFVDDYPFNEHLHHIKEADLFESYGSYPNQMAQAADISAKISGILHFNRITSKQTFTIQLDPKYKTGKFFDTVKLICENISFVNSDTARKNNGIGFKISYENEDPSTDLPHTITISMSGQMTSYFLAKYLPGRVAHELLHAYEDYMLTASYNEYLKKLAEIDDDIDSSLNVKELKHQNIQSRLKSDYYVEWFNIYSTALQYQNTPVALSHQIKDFAYLNYVLNSEEINANLAQLNQEIDQNKVNCRNRDELFKSVQNAGTFIRWKTIETLMNMISNFSTADKERIIKDIHRISDLDNSDLAKWTVKDIDHRIYILRKRFRRMRDKITSNTDKLLTDILGLY